MVQYGADRVQEYRQLFEGRVALLTGPSGRTGDNRPTIDVLKENCNLVLLLAPEHGVRGDKAAGALFEDEIDRESGLTVRSLYTKTSKRLSPETLTLFDTLVYDLADVGCRYYTFLTTLRYCIEDCAAAGQRLVVLDRPPPLGDRVEGGLLRPETQSFVGGYPMPVCYGLIERRLKHRRAVGQGRAVAVRALKVRKDGHNGALRERAGLAGVIKAAQVRFDRVRQRVHARLRRDARRQAGGERGVQNGIARDEAEVGDGILVVPVRHDGGDGRLRARARRCGHGDERRDAAADL